ncbi:MAG TPA: CPBP family intramembrane glutamic endopeptidase [Verrucomicrobiae bacterium]|jgi:membrane protease YdiL (CAAX protease family)|nr:CPBP family intramembrane glutamic endopeptidase [Verrucomicrobiae bacterium]
MLADKPWKLDAAVRLFLGVITTFCLGMLVSGLLIPSTTDSPQTRVAFWQIVLSACSLEIPALIWIGFFLRRHSVSWKEAFGLQMTSPLRAAAYGLLAAALFLPVAMGFRQLSESVMDLAHFNPQDQAAVQTLQDPGLTVAEKTALGVIMIVFAPLVEEALFRGILYPAIKQSGWPRLALWGSSTLFALVHFNMVTFLPLLVFALVLVYLYETFQNLLVPIVAHAVFNAVNFLTIIFMDQILQVLHLT